VESEHPEIIRIISFHDSDACDIRFEAASAGSSKIHWRGGADEGSIELRALPLERIELKYHLCPDGTEAAYLVRSGHVIRLDTTYLAADGTPLESDEWKGSIPEGLTFSSFSLGTLQLVGPSEPKSVAFSPQPNSAP